MRLPRLSTIALATLTVSLLALIIQRLYTGTEVQPLLGTAPRIVELPHLDIVDDRKVVDFSAMREQPLFYASRRYYVAPPPPAAPVSPPKPDYRLSGVLIIPGRPAVAVLFQNATGAARKIKAGDDLEGWSVQAVEKNRVVIRYNEETIELVKTSLTSTSGLQIVMRAQTTSTIPATGVRLLEVSTALSAGSAQSSAQLGGPGRVRYLPAPNFRAPQ